MERSDPPAADRKRLAGGLSGSAFASYAFNKAHAACYAVVAVQTAWLKYYYPSEFMAAMMNSVVGNAAKIAGYIQYCRDRGIPVLPPHVNASDRKFTVETDEEGRRCVRMGMSGVKNVGNAAVDSIVRERTLGGPYRDIYDFCRRADSDAVNKRCVESLIMAGAADGQSAARGRAGRLRGHRRRQHHQMHRGISVCPVRQMDPEPDRCDRKCVSSPIPYCRRKTGVPWAGSCRGRCGFPATG